MFGDYYINSMRCCAPCRGGGGGYSGIEWLPTTKWLRRAEVANIKKGAVNFKLNALQG